MAQTVGTWVVRSWERDIPWLQARAQISRVFPTALSPTRTHFTSSDRGCSSSISSYNNNNNISQTVISLLDLMNGIFHLIFHHGSGNQNTQKFFEFNTL